MQAFQKCLIEKLKLQIDPYQKDIIIDRDKIKYILGRAYHIPKEYHLEIIDNLVTDGVVVVLDKRRVQILE